MATQSIYADGEEIKAIRETARETNTIISMGISEKSKASVACLYNSNLLINYDGQVLVHHRKLVPTFYEKLTWSPGDGFGLRVADTKFGRIGALICGENTNPLARYSLMAQQEQIHLSCWPPVWPTRVPPPTTTVETSTSTATGPRNYDAGSASRLRAAAHSFEAKAFGVMCSAYLDQEAIDTVVAGSSNPDIVEHGLRNSPAGISMILDPTGAPCPSFTVDEESKEEKPTDFLQNQEGIIYADIDLNRCIEGKQYQDVVGGYQRFDIFQLQVNRSRKDPVIFTEGDSQE